MSSPHTSTPEELALKARFQERREILSGETSDPLSKSSPHSSPGFQRAWRQAQALSEARARPPQRSRSPSWGLAALSLAALTLLLTFTPHEEPLNTSELSTQRALTQSGPDGLDEEGWLEPLAWGSGWLEGEEWSPQWPSEPSSPPFTL